MHKRKLLDQGFLKLDHEQHTLRDTERQTDRQTRPSALSRCIHGW